MWTIFKLNLEMWFIIFFSEIEGDLCFSRFFILKILKILFVFFLDI